MFEIQPYTPEKKAQWDAFVANSKNATFLLMRDYMDYHSDRFTDCSLMVYRRGKLYALLPASLHTSGETCGSESEGSTCEVRSHGGLTYGGFVTSAKATTEEMLTVLQLVKEHYKAIGANSLLYKPIPHIYHRLPAEEDLYAIFREGATLAGRDASSAIYQANPVKMRDIRKAGARHAAEAGIILRSDPCFDPFWKVLSDNLVERFGVAPVHTPEEIKALHSRFPDNIRLHTAWLGDECVAGVVIFLCGRVAHVQYISASHTGKTAGALDLLFINLITNEYRDVPIFEFGKSTEELGHYLNSSLIYQKEGFGARTIVYDTYTIPLD